MLYKVSVLALLMTTFSSFKIITKTNTEYDKFQRLKQNALIAGKVGHENVYDLTGIDGCNKSRIKYLGIVKTSQGKKYKILTSFHVFRTSNNTCHGASTIEIYTLKNKFIGQYTVGMPDDLPDELKNNRLIYLTNSEDCNLRKDRSIDLRHGLPKSFFIKCSKNGGDIYSFSSGE
jgi:hypothetical protein